MALTRVAPAGIGSTPGTGYVIGDSFLHSRGLNSIDANYTGIVTTQSLRVIGDLEVEGTTTTLDTALTEVDKLEVGANNNTVGVAVTQSGSGYVATFEGGNFGIGNNTPDAPLRVTSSAVSEASQANDIAVFERNDNGYLKVYTPNNKKGGIVFGDPDSPFVGATLYDHSTNKLEFWTGSGPRMYVNSSGNVGIGENTPGTILHIKKNDATGPTITLENGSNETYINNWGSSGPSGRTNRFEINAVLTSSLALAGQYISLQTGAAGDSNERLRVTSGGDVGIGDNAPNSNYGTNLSVHSTATDGARLKLSDGTTGKGNTDGFDLISTGGVAYIIQRENADMSFSTNNAERLRIDSSGRLLKSGQASLTSTSLPHPIQIAADSDAQNIACFGRASDDISAIDFYEADKTTNLGEIQYRRDHVNFRHRVGYISFATGGVTEKLRITSDGKLGLGESSPEFKFHSKETGGSTIAGLFETNQTDSYISFQASGTTAGSTVRIGAVADNFVAFINGGERLRITDGGQVRIGNSSITVSNSADDLIIGLDSPGGDRGVTIISGTSGTGNIFFSDTNTSGVGNRMGTITYDHSGNYMRFSTAGNNERLRIRSDGKISAGTALDVSNSYEFSIRGADGTGCLYAHGRNHYLSTRSTSHASLTLKKSNSDSDGIDYLQLRDSSNAAKFVLNGDGTLQILDSIKHMGDTDTAIRFPAGDTITAETGGSERLRIDSNGRIGTNGRAPSSYNNPDLLISGDNATLTIMGDGSTNNSSIAAIKFRVAGASTGDYTKSAIFAKRMGGYNDLAMIFAMDTAADANGVNLGNEVMRIASNGRIGINRQSPSYMLDIIGNSSTGANCIRITDGAETGHGSHPAKIVAGGTYYHEMQMHSRRFAVHTYDGSNIAERFRVHQTGQVLLGTQSPLNSLPGIQMYLSGGDPSLVGCKADNNPGQYVTLLKLAGYSQSSSSFRENAAILFETNTANNSGNASGRILFRTEGLNETNGPSTRAVITAEGKMGIGNESPSGILDVKSTQTSSLKTFLRLGDSGNGGSYFDFNMSDQSSGVDEMFPQKRWICSKIRMD